MDWEKGYCYIKTSYFPPSKQNRSWIRFIWYATKSDLKNAAPVDASQFAKKDDLANIKLEVDRLEIDKLEKVLSDLSNLKK